MEYLVGPNPPNLCPAKKTGYTEYGVTSYIKVDLTEYNIGQHTV